MRRPWFIRWPRTPKKTLRPELSGRLARDTVCLRENNFSWKMLFTRIMRTVGWRSTNETMLTPIHWEESLQTSNFKPSNYPWCNTFCKCNVMSSWKKISSYIWMKRELKWNQNYKSSLKTDSVSTVCNSFIFIRTIVCGKKDLILLFIQY